MFFICIRVGDLIAFGCYGALCVQYLARLFSMLDNDANVDAYVSKLPTLKLFFLAYF